MVAKAAAGSAVGSEAGWASAEAEVAAGKGMVERACRLAQKRGMSHWRDRKSSFHTDSWSNVSHTAVGRMGGTVR